MNPNKMEGKTLRLLAAVPAMLALGGGLLALRGSGSNESDQLEWCRSAARTAADNADYKTASICYARLLQAQPRDKEVAFNLAESLHALGQREGAQSLMNRLALDDYPPAHLWLAKQILIEPNQSIDLLKNAELHLKHQWNNPAVNFWAAILYAHQGRWNDAENAAAKVPDQIQTLSGLLFQIAKAQGNAEQIKRWEQK